MNMIVTMCSLRALPDNVAWLIAVGRSGDEDDFDGDGSECSNVIMGSIESIGAEGDGSIGVRDNDNVDVTAKVSYFVSQDVLIVWKEKHIKNDFAVLAP